MAPSHITKHAIPSWGGDHSHWTSLLGRHAPLSWHWEWEETMGSCLGARKRGRAKSPSCSQMWLCPRWSGKHFLVLAVPQVINHFHFPLLRVFFFLIFFSFLVGKISSPARVAQLNKKKASLQILRDPGCAKGLHLASALRATRVLQSQGRA